MNHVKLYFITKINVAPLVQKDWREQMFLGRAHFICALQINACIQSLKLRKTVTHAADVPDEQKTKILDDAQLIFKYDVECDD